MHFPKPASRFFPDRHYDIVITPLKEFGSHRPSSLYIKYPDYFRVKGKPIAAILPSPNPLHSEERASVDTR